VLACEQQHRITGQEANEAEGSDRHADEGGDQKADLDQYEAEHPVFSRVDGAPANTFPLESGKVLECDRHGLFRVTR
jgi:hypothetical protein